jgi:hypothetical protein
MRRPSVPTIIASVALFFALSGGAYAAHHYLISSTSQIKPSVLRTLKGRAGPAGGQGPTGPAGPAGPTLLGHLVQVIGPEAFAEPFKIAVSIATCPVGDDVVSGGYLMVGVLTNVFIQDTPTPQTWEAAIGNASEQLAHIEAVAFCAPAGQAVTASSHAGHIAEAIAKEQAALKRP